jgi:Putative zinc-finger
VKHELNDTPEPAAVRDWHPHQEMLADYAAGGVAEVAAWSIETHLEACPSCRAAVSAHVDGDRLARNRAVLLALTAVPEMGWPTRLAGRCGVPEHVLVLLAATPSLRRSWLLAVLGVLAAVTGEAVLVQYLWPAHSGSPGVGVDPHAAVLGPFVLLGPLLVLAGVSAAFLPALDPSARLTVAAPFSSVTLLLVRSMSALLAALVPVVCAALLLPGPGWLPAALLLPSLAVCALALAVATAVGPVAAVVSAAVSWALPVLVLAVTRSPLVTVRDHGQALYGVVLALAAFVVFVRRDRFERGWV